MSTPPSPLAGSRRAALRSAARVGVDVAVVGGGITGAAVAFEAASRGLTVLLVERDDLASGTSSKSSKLVHGGLRYLARADVAMVAEGVRERGRLRRMAPHLVRPLRFVIPVDDRAMQLQLAAGLALYDAMASLGPARRRRRLSRRDVTAVAPGLRAGFRHGGWMYDDCQTDDARLTLHLAMAAARHGALVANHAEATALDLRGGRVRGLRVVDRLHGTTHDVAARWVVSAAGVWAEHVMGLAPWDGDRIRVRPAKGVHLAFRRAQLPVECAVTVPSVRDDGRHAFVVPWGEQVYVGTTDDDYDGPVDAPGVTPDDAAYLLDAVNRAFATSWTADDAIGAWAGTRPLLESGPGGTSADLSRRHAVLDRPRGLVTVTGGKLTTCRQMAQDVVDALGRDGARVGRSRTAHLRAGVAGDARTALARTQEAARSAGLSPRVAAGLFHRHGDLAPTVVAMARAEEAGTDPLVEDLPYLRGEVRWAVRNEQARSVDDVLQRRLRVSLRDAAAGGRAIGWTADVLADELGWDDATRAASIADYRSAVSTERGVVPLS